MRGRKKTVVADQKSRKSRAKNKKVAPPKTNCPKGKKVFARMKQGYVPNMMLCARVYGTGLRKN